MCSQDGIQGVQHLLSLRLYFFLSSLQNAWRSFAPIARSSTLDSYVFIACSSWLRSHPYIRISLGRFELLALGEYQRVCHATLAPPERVPYKALIMIKRWPCSSLNSGPAMMHSFFISVGFKIMHFQHLLPRFPNHWAGIGKQPFWGSSMRPLQNRWIQQVLWVRCPSCNKSCFESAIMFDCIYKVDSDLLKTIRCDCFTIMELCFTLCPWRPCIHGSELTQGPLHLANVCCFFLCQVLKHHCNPLGTWKPVLISSWCSNLVNPGLFDSSDESFGSLGISFEVFPSCCVKKIMFLGINCTSNWIILGNECLGAHKWPPQTPIQP